jgi:glycosyltransferase involved in cell wall biosynthesis
MPGTAVSWTVVLPTYKRPAMLKRAIESCIAQTQPCEIIVVDDCSPDDTAAVVGQFPQVVYIRNPTNLGHSRTVNLGMERASGSWIKHLDDDDFLHPDCLREMTRVITAARIHGHDPKIVSCVSVNVDSGENPLSRTRTLPIGKAMLIKRQDIVTIMMLDQAPFGTPVQVGHERQAALAVGGWNAQRPIKFLNGDESEFWIKVAPQGDAIFMPDALAYRTLWSGNETPSHFERLHISRYLKARVVEQATGCEPGTGSVPPDIARYLDLHWGLVALKDRKISTALKLIPRGMFHLKSYSYIWRRSRSTDALKCLYALD